MIATRGPAGSGLAVERAGGVEQLLARSAPRRSRPAGTRPARPPRVAASAAVCDAAARAPASDFPVLATITGLVGVTVRRAVSTNARPSARDSRRKHSVRGGGVAASSPSSSAIVTSQVLPGARILAKRARSSAARV